MGNTFPGRLRTEIHPVHPHVCGEYAHQQKIRIRYIRFIPTCVGNTICYGLASLFYNRFIPTCVGNTHTDSRPKLHNDGSSPRVWGIRGGLRLLAVLQGGSSPRVWGIRDAVPFLPRFAGSSPRVWGILREFGVFHGVLRFIPTCVGNTASVKAEGSKHAVHPHVCGEYHLRRLRSTPAAGSSPRVWGILRASLIEHWFLRFIPTCVGNTQCAGRRRRPRDRFIPTCVGNTCHDFSLRAFFAVHPHVCGEYGTRCYAAASSGGSSPRVWGILVAAGSSTLVSAVHPHVCGEYESADRARWCAFGSSPRVWGIRVLLGSSPRRSAVHPHVCGEYWLAVASAFTRCGSSPRVWGIQSGARFEDLSHLVHPHVCGEYDGECQGEDWLWRFIPTCVGNTCCSGYGLPILSVHPHVCGEYGDPIDDAVEIGGSSPRVWGIHQVRSVDSSIRRFIPTCVGNTMPDGGDSADDVGSSPRVWGIRARGDLPRRRNRFIPTCVGNTSPSHQHPQPPAVHPHVCGEYR